MEKERLQVGEARLTGGRRQSERDNDGGMLGEGNGRCGRRGSGEEESW